ncbi:MAG TPA: sigma 54-interacting transcriptional regulator [Vicinamibacterales bacterium]|nr:sigma 54-interacting transcriptional regulator [Vicinamibacterales bacterium]
MDACAPGLCERRHFESIDLAGALDLASAATSDTPHATDRLRALERAIVQAPNGVAICDEAGRMLVVNNHVASLFGYERGELVGCDLRTIVPDASFAPQWTDPSRRSAAHVHELDGVRKDASLVPLTVAIERLRGGSERLFAASVIDLSAQRKIEARLTAAERQFAFQSLIAEVSTRCAAATADDVDAALGDIMERIAEALTIDRCVAYMPGVETTRLQILFRWSRSHDAFAADDFDARDEMPWIMTKTDCGESVWADALEDLPDPIDREYLRKMGAHGCAAVPLTLNGVRGALVVDTTIARSWSAEMVDRLRLTASVMAQALARKYDLQRTPGGSDETAPARARNGESAAILRRDASAVPTDRPIAADSVAIRRVLDQVHQVAPTTATVLLLGETGVGKEVFAQAIHSHSPRNRRPMIRVSCAAIPSALIESELFGRERGAFTGALSRQIGRFEAANGSTIFLDEIAEMPLDIQVKLLRVIQERTLERLGANDPVKVNVRIIAATNRSLEQAVAAGTFREDLFYRLNVFPIAIPPLRERVDDIPSLVWTFIDEFSRAFGKRIDSISKESLNALLRHSWPGNVRELRNVIEREMIIATGPTLTIAAPRPPSLQRRAVSSKLVDVEVEHIRSVLDGCGWRVRGTGGAAERLGVKPTTLESRMARLGITRESRSPAQA